MKLLIIGLICCMGLNTHAQGLNLATRSHQLNFRNQFLDQIQFRYERLWADKFKVPKSGDRREYRRGKAMNVVGSIILVFSTSYLISGIGILASNNSVQDNRTGAAFLTAGALGTGGSITMIIFGTRKKRRYLNRPLRSPDTEEEPGISRDALVVSKGKSTYKQGSRLVVSGSILASLASFTSITSGIAAAVSNSSCCGNEPNPTAIAVASVSGVLAGAGIAMIVAGARKRKLYRQQLEEVAGL